MKKPSTVIFIEEKLQESYDQLPDNDPVKKGIKKAVKELRKNAFAGTQIPKKLFPKKYVQEHNINNLWKYNLPQGWRLLYTITAKDEIEILTAILEWFNHKDYEKRMKY